MRKPETTLLEASPEGTDREQRLTPEQIEEAAREDEWIEQNFQPLIEGVDERYNESPVLTEAQKESFKAHNKEILDLCVERAIEKGLNKTERAILYFAAIHHDMTKGDVPPEGKENIKNYVLVKHGEAGAEETKELLESKEGEGIINITLSREQSKEGEYNKEKVITAVGNAILRHMGPHRRNEKQRKEDPAFMDIVQDMVNSQLPKGEKIKHPKPENKIDKTLFAADMRSLAGPEGAQKILDIRYGVPNFKKEDILASEFCKKEGIDFSPDEIAFISAYESALAARDSIDKEKDRDDWEWVGEAIENLKEEEYYYGESKELEENPIDVEAVLEKREERLDELKEIKEKVKETLQKQKK